METRRLRRGGRRAFAILAGLVFAGDSSGYAQELAPPAVPHTGFQAPPAWVAASPPMWVRRSTPMMITGIVATALAGPMLIPVLMRMVADCSAGTPGCRAPSGWWVDVLGVLALAQIAIGIPLIVIGKKRVAVAPTPTPVVLLGGSSVTLRWAF